MLDCGHEPTEPHPSFATGYSTWNGATACYACAAVIERMEMASTGTAILYLVQGEAIHRSEVTNWPGTLRFDVFYSSKGRHNMAGTRRDVWFNGPGGLWHGVSLGDWGFVRCKRRKVRRASR